MTGYLVINKELNFIIGARSTLTGAERLVEKLEKLPEKYNPKKRIFTIKECTSSEDWEKFSLIATITGQCGTSLKALEESAKTEKNLKAHRDSIFCAVLNCANLKRSLREKNKNRSITQ